MNKFIQLRENAFNHIENHLFPLIYLEEFEVRKKACNHEEIIVDQLEIIFQLQRQIKINTQDMMDLLTFLGTNDYVDSYVMTIFRKNQWLFKKREFGEQIKKIVKDEEVADSTIHTLLDSCIECQIDWFSVEMLHQLLKKDKLSLDTFSMMLDYIYHFKKAGFKENICNWLTQDYPMTIKIQLIDLFGELYSIEKLDVEKLLPKEEEQALTNYIKSQKKDMDFAVKALTILQSMFYGDFENSGKGNNGGLAIFLKNLGKELSKSDAVEKVITLGVATDWDTNQSLITEYSTGHLFVQIPMFMDRSNSTEFLKKEYIIKRTIARYLEKLALRPDIYHVRFLDNASMAIARLSEEQNKKLVVTLAPDPHRNMSQSTGALQSFDFDLLIEKLNKILIGDKLVRRSDKIVGIGSRVLKDELQQYFPQLKVKENQNKVHMISEGIQIDHSLLKQEGKAVTPDELAGLGVTQSFLEKPIILNVGRLNELKAQDQLVKAWINSDLSTMYNLLIVGGDLEQPNAEEKEMIDFFNEQLALNPHLADNFLHLGALSNDQIRTLEQKIRAEQNDYPQIYLCSSKKEEFGIAILEALSQRFLVLGPKKGGVKSYLKDNVNGFLIDTIDWETIAHATEEIVQRLKNQKESFEKIQQAGQTTVTDNFSMAVITEDFLSLYLSLQTKE